MARKSMATVRRAELAQAAYLALSRHGLKGTTLSSVAAITGMSKASALHYFASKDALLEAALRRAQAIVATEALALLRQSRTPWERVYAILEANLSPTSFTPTLAHAWVALCSEVPHNAKYQRIQKAIYRRNWSNLHTALRMAAPPAQAMRLTQTLISLIDGLWLRCSLQPDGISRAEARQQFDLILDLAFPAEAERLAAKARMEDIAGILFPTGGSGRRGPPPHD